MKRVFAAVIALALAGALVGCTGERVVPRTYADGAPIVEDDAASLGDAGPPRDGGGTPRECFGVASTRGALTVDQAVSAVGCSTAVAEPLSEQLVEQINCLAPGTMTRIDGIAGLSLSSTVVPWLQSAAASGLEDAVRAHGGTLSLNSALRTLPQQLMLYRWYQMGACGITLAASPGTSPHESGLAIDTSEYTAWRSALEAHGWTWHGAGDLVHFDYTGGGTVSLAGRSVLAFQMLWNRNHPEDLIAEDGSYGPQTESRLRMSPTEGFPLGPDCGTPAHEPFAVSWMLDGGEYVFMASASSATSSVEYSADGRVIGTVARATSGMFALRAGICDDGLDHAISARAIDAGGTEVDHGVGLFQARADAAVYVRPVDTSTFEVGLERASGIAAIEVDADGTPVTDDTSGTAHSTRLAVRHTYSMLGTRTFVVRLYDASDALVETRTVMLTLR
ncbi:MAG: M15 family metallopeptidase [Sandaracinus sp.]